MKDKETDPMSELTNDPRNERNPGYYWVRTANDWRIEYCPPKDEFDEVDPTPITREAKPMSWRIASLESELADIKQKRKDELDYIYDLQNQLAEAFHKVTSPEAGPDINIKLRKARELLIRCQTYVFHTPQTAGLLNEIFNWLVDDESRAAIQSSKQTPSKL